MNEAEKKPDMDTTRKEAKTLGIKPSRFGSLSSKSKDPATDRQKWQDRADQRLANRVKKAKKKSLSPAQARKKLLEARLANPNSQVTKEQRSQARFELDLIRQKKWLEPVLVNGQLTSRAKMPRGKTALEKFYGE